MTAENPREDRKTSMMFILYDIGSSGSLNFLNLHSDKPECLLIQQGQKSAIDIGAAGNKPGVFRDGNELNTTDSK